MKSIYDPVGLHWISFAGRFLIERTPLEKSMSIFLKIKLKSLAAESRIIRGEEEKIKRNARAGQAKDQARREALYLHRIGTVRRAARETGLAYGYLKGRAYKEIEVLSCRSPDWKAVAAMIRKYGEWNEIKFEQWKAYEPILRGTSMQMRQDTTSVPSGPTGNGKA